MHPTIRRALSLLGRAYALGWLTIALAVGPGSAVVVDLSGPQLALDHLAAWSRVAHGSGCRR